ncbi:hypothetical protein Cgig2_031239 [Carnegiea gigantea]|uniref:RRM domain-containing protein n=1 Tax=Carnegiea gigantea TaxID=171969 RepID=A0A9Q1QKZ1_9CARY|nr:hypothetical protein Cgig2_031239 [Carnegiea gigantea]
MSRKREKPYYSRHVPYSYPKRHRPLPPEDPPQDKPAPPPALVVIGLPPDCSVLDLKSRFEIYGSISRIRIDKDGVGFISFRSKSAADSALAASLDPSFGISFDSHRVQVMWASEVKEGEAGGIEGERRERRSSLSKLVKGETPLSKHGRGNRLSSAIVNPNASTSNSSVLDPPIKSREIVAYDDIL